MWKVGLVAVLLLQNCVAGQDQFLREVQNPSGPSQVILTGGGFNNGNTEDFASQPLSAAEQSQQQVDTGLTQALPLQVAGGGNPIPQNGIAENPFTNGDDGFGLRLSEQPSPQPVQQSSPPQAPQQPQPDQPQTALHHQQLTLPPLPAGQQYVDVYGRPLIFEHPQVQVAQPQPAPVAAPVAAPVQAQQPVLQTQAFVDQYGRQLAQYQTVPGAPQVGAPPAVLHHQVIQPAGVPFVQQLIQPGVAPLLHHAIQPAAIPVAQKIVQPAVLPVQKVVHQLPLVVKEKVVAAPLSLHTYAVPAVHKVGDLAIPYAQKVVYAKTPNAGVVFPPAVPAPAHVKSVEKTIVPGVKAVESVAVAPPVVVQPAPVPVVHQEAHPAPLVYQHQVLFQQPGYAVEHHPQQVFHHQPLNQHHFIQPHVQVLEQPAVAHPPPEIAHAPHTVFPFEAHPGLPVAHAPQLHYVGGPAPLPVVKKIIPAVAKVPVVAKTLIPDFTLIHQPILKKAEFQRHIFNVKHGSEPVIYQDLCTVYPYQKNLRACVLKKAVLPELHHPDIRTINAEEQQQQPIPDQTIAGGSVAVAPLPDEVAPTAVVTKDPPKNIQETIKRESARLREQAVGATSSTTTVQPETAESRDSTAPGKSDRRKKSSSRNKEFKLV